MRLRNKILVNYAGTALIGVINILSLMAYSRLFGHDKWGVIAAYITILNVMMMAEMGILQIYTAEYGVSSAKHSIREKYLRAILLIASIAPTIILVLSLFGRAIDNSIWPAWNNFSLLTLACLFFSVSLLNNFIYADLNAEQKHFEQNLRQILFLLIKNITVVILISYWPPDPIIYFLVFLFVSIFELIYNARYLNLKSVIGGYKFPETRDFFKSTGKITVAVMMGILVFNFDRLFLSSVLSPQIFGVYAIVVTVGLYFLQLQYPLMKTFLPYLSQGNSEQDLVSNNRKILKLQLLTVTIILAPVLLIGGIFSSSILALFSIHSSGDSGPIILFRAILISIYLNAIYHVIYQRMIISGEGDFIFRVNLIGLIVYLVTMINFGATSPFITGAVCWILVALVQLAGGIYFAFVHDKSDG